MLCELVSCQVHLKSSAIELENHSIQLDIICSPAKSGKENSVNEFESPLNKSC